MSIHAPLVFLKNDVEVYRTRVPVGYVAADRSEAMVVGDAIATAMMARSFLPSRGKSLPDYDHLEVRIGGGGDTYIIPRYEGLDPLFALERAGVPTEHVLAQSLSLLNDLKALTCTRDVWIAIKYTTNYADELEGRLRREMR